MDPFVNFIMDPLNTGVVWCAPLIFQMLIRKHINYYHKYDTDYHVPYDTAMLWISANVNFYKLKMKELALAPIGDGLKPFSYEYWFTFDDVMELEEGARQFLSELHEVNFDSIIDSDEIKHFMQIACEYCFTVIDKYQAVIEMLYIKCRMVRRAAHGQATLEEQEEDEARMLYLKNDTNAMFDTDFIGGEECPVCYDDKVLDLCCSNNHALCRACWQNPRVTRCPLCRERRPPLF